MALRPYQSDLKARVRAKIADGIKRVVMQLTTGGGKTNIAEDILRDCAARGNVGWFVAHRNNLISQAARRFRKAGLTVGQIKAGQKYDPEIAIQVASIQSLQRRLTKIKAPDLIIIDEAHHAIAPGYRKLLEAFPNARVIGLTGTPWLLDGRGLIEVFEDMECGPKPSEMIREGFLLPSRVKGPKSKLDVARLRGKGGEFDLEKVEELLAKKSVTGDVVATFQELFPSDGRGIAFCCSVGHAEIVAEAFRAAGVSAETMTGETDEDEREAIIQRVTAGTTRILSVCDVASEGFDLPELEAAILLRATESLTLALQQMARAIRPVYADGYDLETLEGRHAAIAASGKRNAWIIDAAGNTLRHGIPELDHVWSLEPRDKKAQAARKTEDGEDLAVRQCMKCYEIYPAGPTCPGCGHHQPPESRIPKAEKDRLEEIAKEELERLNRERIAREKAEQGKAQTVPELTALGRQRGHPDPAGWAWNVYNNRKRKRRR